MREQAYLKLDSVKTMGTRGKINAIWWNIKINLQKLANICEYKFPKWPKWKYSNQFGGRATFLQVESSQVAFNAVCQAHTVTMKCKWALKAI